jgi:serine/threonine-protein kinase
MDFGGQRYSSTGCFLRRLLSGDNLIGEKLESDQSKTYLILGKIGEGGMGRVYKAADQNGREVAIKITIVEQGMKRFQLEAAILKLLGKHPNIPELFDWGLEKAEIKFCVMEYVAGDPLDAIIKKKPGWFYERPLLHTIEMAVDILTALSHVHGKKVVHRDVKPHNIIVQRSPDGKKSLKLMDFGVSKILERGFLSFLHRRMPFEEKTLTLPGQPIGTLGYAPREQIDGGYVSESADIFACAVTLYELAIGRALFSQPTISGYLREFEGFVFRPIEFENESQYVTARLNAILEKALNKEPDHRYPRAAKMLQDILPLKKELMKVNFHEIKSLL